MSKKVLVTLAILAVIMTATALWRMSVLPFWGHWTLLYLLGVWLLSAVIVGSIGRYRSTDWRMFSLPVLSAVLLSAGFPPYPFIGLSFIAFVPLLLHDVKTRENNYRRRRYNWQLFSGLWLWNILTTFWVENTLFFSGMIANVLNALLMMIPFILFRRVAPFVPSKWIRYFGFIAFWICYEYLHLNWEISWPWLILGHQFAHVPALIQWYEYTGVLGGTLWILLINFIIFDRFSSLIRKKINWQKDWILPAILIIPIIVSVIRFQQYQPKGQQANVLVIQPNYNPHIDQYIPENEYLQGYLDLIEANISNDTRFILLPESAIKRLRQSRTSSNKMIRSLQNVLNQYPQASIISGASMNQVWGSSPPEETDNYRIQERDGRAPIYWQHYNAALHIDTANIDFYYKSKFVPGAEVVPYPNIFWIIRPLADALGGSLEGMGTQESRHSFQKDALSLAPVICYESVYGEYASRYVTQGNAQALGIITIDGWWDRTAGHLQHLYIGALRAVELRKDIARSAVSGISGFIDQRGVVVKQSEYELSAALEHPIRFNNTVTFYAQWGDLIGRLSVFMALIVLFNAIRVYYEKLKNI